jgi:hypothetical protein
LTDKPIINSIQDFSTDGLSQLRLWLETFLRPDIDKLINQGGGGTSAVRKILACWAGPLPIATGAGLVWEVPYDSDGSTLTFTLNRAFARIESTQPSSVQIAVEKSAGGSSFSASTVTTLTIAASSYETTNTGLSTSVSSGNLLRISFVSLPGSTPQPNFTVEVIGSQ